MSELFNAAKSNNAALIHQLCQSGFNPNEIDPTSGQTPLHVAADAGNGDAIIALLLNGANINCQTFSGNTPLHFAVLGEQLNAVKLLASYQANLEIVNHLGMTPIHSAHCICENQIVSYLQSIGSKVDVNAFQARRLLANVSGNDALFNYLSQIDHVDYKNGGYFQEATNQIKTMLEAFVVQQKLDSNSFQPILTDLDNLLKQQKLNSHFGKLIKTGCLNHILYVLVKQRNATNSDLILAERGLFATKQQNGDKVDSLRMLSVPNHLVDLIKNKLISTANKNPQDSYQVIFNDIPALVNSNYMPTVIGQKPFKTPHCYIENLKTAVLAEFVASFGIQLGKLYYKKFDVFMHMVALDIYKRDCNDANRYEVIKLCQDILEKKIEKLKVLLQQQQLIQNQPVYAAQPVSRFF